MRNPKFIEMARLFNVEQKHLGKFHVQQITQCRELLLEVIKDAAKDKDGKPIFYTSLKRATRSGRTQAFSIHYFNDTIGEMHSLNYVASILLCQRLDAQQRYIISKTTDYPTGKNLIWALSKWIKFGKRQRTDLIMHKEL